MTSQLAKQLQSLQLDAAQSSGRNTSFLFNRADAQSYSREQVLQLAVEGLQSLFALDNRMHPFVDKLFNRAQTRQERGMMSAEANKALDDVLERFLTLLSPHLFLTCAQQVFEYLVRVHEVHVYNVLAVLRAFLPYHDHNIFARVLLLLDLRDTGFQFLSVNQERGAALLREHLILACAESRKALRLVCSAMAMSVRMDVYHNAVYALFASVACRLAAHEDAEAHWRILLPYVLEFLALSHPAGGRVSTNNVGVLAMAEKSSDLTGNGDNAEGVMIHAVPAEHTHTLQDPHATELPVHHATEQCKEVNPSSARSPAVRESVCTALLVLATWGTSVKFSTTLLTTVIRRLVALLRQYDSPSADSSSSLSNLLMLTNLLFESHREVVMQTTFTPVLRVLIDLPWARWDDGLQRVCHAGYDSMSALMDVLVRYCLNRVRVAQSMRSVPMEVLLFLSFSAERLPLSDTLVRRTLRTIFALDCTSRSTNDTTIMLNSNAGNDKKHNLTNNADSECKNTDEEEIDAHTLEVDDARTPSLAQSSILDAAYDTFCRSVVAALERYYPDVFDHTLARALRHGSASATAFVARHLGNEARYSVVRLTPHDSVCIDEDEENEQQTGKQSVAEHPNNDDGSNSKDISNKYNYNETDSNGRTITTSTQPSRVSKLPLFACLLHRHSEIRILGVNALRRMSLSQLLRCSMPSRSSSQSTPTTVDIAPVQRVHHARGNSLMDLLTHVMSYEQDEQVAASLIRAAAVALSSLSAILHSPHTQSTAEDGMKQQRSCVGVDVSVPQALQAYTDLHCALQTLLVAQGNHNKTDTMSSLTTMTSSSLLCPAKSRVSLHEAIAHEVYVPLLKGCGHIRPAITTTTLKSTRVGDASDRVDASAKARSVLLYHAIQFYLSLAEPDSANELTEGMQRPTSKQGASVKEDARHAVRRVMAEALHSIGAHPCHRNNDEKSKSNTAKNNMSNSVTCINTTSNNDRTDSENDGKDASFTMWVNANHVSDMLALVCGSATLLGAIRQEAYHRLPSALLAAHELLLDEQLEQQQQREHSETSANASRVTAWAAQKRARQHAVRAEVYLSASACLFSCAGGANDRANPRGAILAVDHRTKQTLRTLLSFLLGCHAFSRSRVASAGKATSRAHRTHESKSTTNRRNHKTDNDMEDKDVQQEDEHDAVSMPMMGYLVLLQNIQSTERISGAPCSPAATASSPSSASAKVGRHAENSTAALTRSFLPHNALTRGLASIMGSIMSRLLGSEIDDNSTDKKSNEDDVAEVLAMMLRLLGCLGYPAPSLNTPMCDILARAYFVLLDHTEPAAAAAAASRTHTSDDNVVCVKDEIDAIYDRLALNWCTWVQEAVFGEANFKNTNVVNAPPVQTSSALPVSPAALALCLFAPLCSSKVTTPSRTSTKLCMLKDALHHTGKAAVYNILGAVVVRHGDSKSSEAAQRGRRSCTRQNVSNTMQRDTNNNSNVSNAAAEDAVHISVSAVADIVATLNDPKTPLTSAGCALVCDLLALESTASLSVLNKSHSAAAASATAASLSSHRRAAHKNDTNKNEQQWPQQQDEEKRVLSSVCAGHFVIPWTVATTVVTAFFAEPNAVANQIGAPLYLSHRLLPRLLCALGRTQNYTKKQIYPSHSYEETIAAAHFVLAVARRCRLEPSPSTPSSTPSVRAALPSRGRETDASNDAVVQFCATLLLPQPSRILTSVPSASSSALPTIFGSSYVSAALTMMATSFHTYNPSSLSQDGVNWSESTDAWLEEARCHLYPRVLQCLTRSGNDVARMCLNTQGGYRAFFLPFVDQVRAKAMRQLSCERNCNNNNGHNRADNINKENSDDMHHTTCASARSMKSRRVKLTDEQEHKSNNNHSNTRSDTDNVEELHCITAFEWEVLEVCMDFLAPASMTEPSAPPTNTMPSTVSWQAPVWCRLSTNPMHYRTACHVMDICATCLGKTNTGNDLINKDEKGREDNACDDSWRRTMSTLSALRILRALLRTIPNVVYDDHLSEPLDARTHIASGHVPFASNGTSTSAPLSHRRRHGGVTVLISAGESDCDDDNEDTNRIEDGMEQNESDLVNPPSPLHLVQLLMDRFGLPALAPLLRYHGGYSDTNKNSMDVSTNCSNNTSTKSEKESSLSLLGTSSSSYSLVNVYARQALLFFTDVVHLCTSHTRLLAEQSSQHTGAVRVRQVAVKQIMSLMSALLTHSPSSADAADANDAKNNESAASATVPGAQTTMHEMTRTENGLLESDEDGNVSDVVAALLRGMTPLLTVSQRKPSSTHRDHRDTDSASSSAPFALHIPLLALLVRMERVDGAAALRFRRAWEVCQDILLSFDVQQQLHCLARMMQLVMDPHTHLAELASQHDSVVIHNTHSDCHDTRNGARAKKTPRTENNSSHATVSRDADDELSHMGTAHVFRKMLKPNQVINRQEIILNLINTSVKSERFLGPFIERQRRSHVHSSRDKDAMQTNEEDEEEEQHKQRTEGSGDACTDLLVCALEMYAHYTDLNAAVPNDTIARTHGEHISNKRNDYGNHTPITAEQSEHGQQQQREETFYSEDKSYTMLLELLSGNTLACILAGINESTFVLCLRRLLHDPRPALRLRGLEALLDRLHHALPTDEYTISDAAMRQRRAELRDPRCKLTLMDLVQVKARPLTTKRSFELFARLRELVQRSVDELTGHAHDEQHKKNRSERSNHNDRIRSPTDTTVLSPRLCIADREQCLSMAQLSIACAEELVRIIGSGGSLQAEKTLLNVNRSRRVTESTLTKLFGNKSRLQEVHAFVRELYMDLLPRLAQCAHDEERSRNFTNNRDRDDSGAKINCTMHKHNAMTPKRSRKTPLDTITRSTMQEGILALMSTVMTALGSVIQVMGSAATSSTHGDALLRAVVYDAARQLHMSATLDRPQNSIMHNSRKSRSEGVNHTDEENAVVNSSASCATSVLAMLRHATLATLIRAFPLYWQLSYPYLSAMLYCATHRRNIDDAETRHLCDELMTLLEAVLEPGVFVEATAACLRGVILHPNAAHNKQNNIYNTSIDNTINEDKESAANVQGSSTKRSGLASTPLRTWHLRIRVATHSIAFFYASIQRRVGSMKKEELMLMPFLTRGTTAEDNFWLSSLDMLIRTAITSRSPAVLSSSEVVMPVLQAYTTFFLKFRARRCAGFIRAVAEWVFGNNDNTAGRGDDNRKDRNDNDDDSEKDKDGDDERLAQPRHGFKRVKMGDSSSSSNRNTNANHTNPHAQCSNMRAKEGISDCDDEETSSVTVAPTQLHACLVFYALVNHLLDSLGGIFDFAFPVVVPYLVSTLTNYATSKHTHATRLSSETATAAVAAQGEIVKSTTGRNHATLDGADLHSITTSLIALCLEQAVDSVRRMALAQIPGADYDYSISLDVYFATPEVFNSVMPALIHQLHNTVYLTDAVHDFSFRVEHSIIPAVRAFFRCLHSHTLQSKTQAEMVRSLRHPDRRVRLMVLRCLDGVYADGGEELAARLMAEMLPAVVELTEDSSSAVVEEARLLCTNLSHMTGQDVLHAMS